MPGLTMMPRAACLVGIALGASVVLACGRASSPHEPTPATPPQAASIADRDACSLLEPKEVEAVLGASLATPPFLSRDGLPADDGSACEYEDATLHAITIDVEWDGGATAFKTYGAFQGVLTQTTKGLLHLADGVEVAGEWDEARAIGCCTFVALRGDQIVTVDVGGSRASMSAAGMLADLAVKRLDHALSISGAAAVTSARAFESAHRPKRRDACALVSRAEAEAIVGKLAGDPTSLDDRCVYEHALDSAAAPTYVLKVRWTGGLSDFRQENAAAATFSKGFAANMTPSGASTRALESSLIGDDLAANAAWEIAHFSIMGLSAVKKDVSISIEPQGGSREHTIKLMERALSKL